MRRYFYYAALGIRFTVLIIIAPIVLPFAGVGWFIEHRVWLVGKIQSSDYPPGLFDKDGPCASDQLGL